MHTISFVLHVPQPYSTYKLYATQSMATHNPQQTCRRLRWWSTVGPSWSLAIIASCNDCKHNLAMLICVCCVSSLQSQVSSPVCSSAGARRKSFPQNFPQVFLLLPPSTLPLWSWLGRLHRISTIVAASAANKPANKAKTTHQQQQQQCARVSS